MKTLIAAASALLLTAGAAYAATTTTQPPANSQNQPAAAPTANLQKQVKNNLAKAGFTDIKIMPESFLVRAKDQQGNAVMMVMNPDSFTEVTSIAPKNANTADKTSASTGAASTPAASTTKE